MRRLGFSTKDWINYHTGRRKLEEPGFSTFRLCRRDMDWQVDEVALVVVQPRRKGGGDILGPAEIIRKESRCLLSSRLHGVQCVTTYEALADGFSSLSDMEHWLYNTHSNRVLEEAINKLTLRYI